MTTTLERPLLEIEFAAPAAPDRIVMDARPGPATFDDRVRALLPFGFTERQTQFLVTVALNSGVCLRRHYAAFAGLRHGQGVRDFFARLVRRRLASCVTFRRDRGFVYQLHASAIYDAIGQPDNRHRRGMSPALIARKLMLLDYVLVAPANAWYATEADKVALFTHQFHVPLADLPHRVYRTPLPGVALTTTRYFIHKQPIGLTGSSASEVERANRPADPQEATPPTAVSFVYLVTDSTSQAFRQFLDDHARLFAHLPAWRVIAVFPRHVNGEPPCARAFQQFAGAAQRARSVLEVAALRQYFRARDLHDRGEIAQLSVAEIDQWRAARRHYGAPAFESLYRHWQHAGDAAFGLADASARAVANAITSGHGQLVTSQLPWRYDRFGTRAGIA
jgi:hypothetical protein